MSELRCHRCGRRVKPGSLVGVWGPKCAVLMGVQRREKKERPEPVRRVSVVRSDARQLELEFA